METLAAVLLALLACAMASAKVVTAPVAYESGGTELEGYLAYDDALAGKRPGVLVFHEWWGLNDYAKNRAEALAEMGYVAFAADMYGKGVLAKTMDEAGKLAGQFRGRWDEGGRDLMRERAQAALAVLAKNPLVDTAHMAAIGYCFGGTVALELAYSGADLAGIATFHGGLVPPRESDLKHIKAAVLILHGADDPTVSQEAIAGTQEGLRKAGADWQMVYYGGAVHGFSNPANKGSASPAVLYNEKAARRSWQAMKDFFTEILGRP